MTCHTAWPPERQQIDETVDEANSIILRGTMRLCCRTFREDFQSSSCLRASKRPKTDVDDWRLVKPTVTTSIPVSAVRSDSGTEGFPAPRPNARKSDLQDLSKHLK